MVFYCQMTVFSKKIVFRDKIIKVSNRNKHSESKTLNKETVKWKLYKFIMVV